MPTHDCSNCDIEECPIREIAPWLNEHEDEVDVVTEETRFSLAQACALAVRGMPVYDSRTVTVSIRDAFWLGYHKGRIFQDVPEVFKK